MRLFDKIKASVRGFFDDFTGANDEFFDELEERLILSDLGAELSSNCVEQLRERVKSKGLRGAGEIKDELKDILLAIFTPSESPPLPSLKEGGNAVVILVIGVNGVGKTTTIGKLAAQYKQSGKKVLLVAGDTFRAAAADQLAIWAERSGSELVRGPEGGDPGAVIYDGLQAAKARSSDVVICDTAGRLHNKTNLMKELEKINRIIDREMPEATRENLLVIDAATGQNGLIQAKQFTEVTGVTGLVLTKLDGTAKGGIVFAVTEQLGIPVKYAGIGESVADLVEFDAEDFVDAILAGNGE
ncbi:MAG: signal recognition particle-docking protein FtsY [Oscillospiraceae bacterium]|jgi:fused signal recognition particle receptor|nr:signal recognition particle-docking protein FtsY [Oscillospiraceae bacterium]